MINDYRTPWEKMMSQLEKVEGTLQKSKIIKTDVFFDYIERCISKNPKTGKYLVQKSVYEKGVQGKKVVYYGTSLEEARLQLAMWEKDHPLKHKGRGR